MLLALWPPPRTEGSVLACALPLPSARRLLRRTLVTYPARKALAHAQLQTRNHDQAYNKGDPCGRNVPDMLSGFIVPITQIIPQITRVNHLGG